jgi:hypothetical protein
LHQIAKSLLSKPALDQEVRVITQSVSNPRTKALPLALEPQVQVFSQQAVALPVDQEVQVRTNFQVPICITAIISIEAYSNTVYLVAPDVPPPNAQDIIAAIPADGISMQDLAMKFKSYHGKKTARVQELVALIKKTAQVSNGRVTRKP